MSIYPNVTEQYLINIDKLAEQQKNRRATESKKKTLKQTRYKKIAGNFEPITEKLEEMDKSTKKLEVI